MVDNHTRRSPLVERDPQSIDQSFAIRPIPILLGASKDEGLEAAAKIYLEKQMHFSSTEKFLKHVLMPLMKTLFGYWKGSQSELIEAIDRSERGFRFKKISFKALKEYLKNFTLYQLWYSVYNLTLIYYVFRQYFREVTSGDTGGLITALGIEKIL